MDHLRITVVRPVAVRFTGWCPAAAHRQFAGAFASWGSPIRLFQASERAPG